MELLIGGDDPSARIALLELAEGLQHSEAHYALVVRVERLGQRASSTGLQARAVMERPPPMGTASAPCVALHCHGSGLSCSVPVGLS
jgi:hypothetical protein